MWTEFNVLDEQSSFPSSLRSEVIKRQELTRIIAASISEYTIRYFILKTLIIFIPCLLKYFDDFMLFWVIYVYIPI